MYNQELKQEYIDFAEKTNRKIREYLEIKFEKLSGMETKFNKDLCCFNVSEIIEAYKLRYYSSLETLLMLNSMLKKYTDFCMNKNLVPDCQNHYVELDKEILNTCINVKSFKNGIITKEVLLDSIQDLYNPSDKFLLLAHFEGFRSVDIIDFRYTDIHNHKAKLLEDREIEISRELEQYAYESSNEYEYIPYMNVDDPRDRHFTFKEEDDRVIKNLYNVNSTTEKTQKRNMYTKIARLKSYMGLNDINIKSLMESGRIDYIKELNKLNNYDSIKDCIYANRDSIINKYGLITSIDRWLVKYEEFCK